MARAIWSGAISFGLVTVPVKLYSATESKSVSFHQLREGTGERIRYQRVGQESGEEVDYKDIVKGYEVEKGRHVIVTPEELESVAPEKSRTIDIEQFVDLAAVDPIYFDRTYYLGPQEDVGAEKPYRLLLEAMKDRGRAAVARFVMRGKEYLAIVRPIGDVLGLETMHFADEIRGPDAVENLPGKARVGDRELAMATQLVDAMTDDWDPAAFRDTYREAVLDLIERKAEGEQIAVERAAEPEPVEDLMAALRASVEASRQRRGGNGAGGSGAMARNDGQAGRLGELSKEELYDRASEAGIPGRSKMKKDELVEALQEAG
jgi:DNA end-binding protein Ku